MIQLSNFQKASYYQELDKVMINDSGDNYITYAKQDLIDMLSLFKQNYLYMAKAKEPDYDQLNHMVGVSLNFEDAVDLFVNKSDHSSCEDLLKYYTVEKIGTTDKPIGTLILKDY